MDAWTVNAHVHHFTKMSARNSARLKEKAQLTEQRAFIVVLFANAIAQAEIVELNVQATNLKQKEETMDVSQNVAAYVHLVIALVVAEVVEGEQ